MTNEERLDKALDELREKLMEGWNIESISANRYTNDSSKKVLVVEIELVES